MLVAVYGTLKRGYGNHRLLSEATFIDTDVVMDFDLAFSGSVGSFPVAMRTDDGSKVVVEVFDIGDDDSILRRLDSLEGVPWMYTREEVVTADGRKVNIYVGTEECFGKGGIPVPLNDAGMYEWKRAY